MNSYYPQKKRSGAWIIVLILVVGIIIYANSKGIINLGAINLGNLSGNQTNSTATQAAVKNISITGVSQTQTVDYPNQNIFLYINGQNDNITIAKDTTVSKISIDGLDNTVNLCKGASPQITNDGQNNQIEYQSC
jgi:hypothetical protein